MSANTTRFKSPVVTSESFTVKTKGKTYQEIRDECLSNKILFEDEEFPTVNASVKFSTSFREGIVWKRPKDLVDDPKLFVGGAGRFDVNAPTMAYTWFSAAATSLVLYETLFSKVVPDDQSFKEEEYAGIFHFYFWQFGEWVEVLVDDRLPTYRGRLLSMQSTERNEFWPALLEKAYAKMFGSYEALEDGVAGEAMGDFTGGVTCKKNLKNLSETELSALFELMTVVRARQGLICCNTEATKSIKKTTVNGLVKGKSFTVTGVHKFTLQRTGQQVPLIRIRYPAGNADSLWTGEWKDNSSLWKQLGDKQKEAAELSFDTDGEFWVTIDEFAGNFEAVELCTLEPLYEQERLGWDYETVEGRWIKGVSAGGCRNFLGTYASNPTFMLKLPKHGDQENRIVNISLMQKDRRRQASKGVENHTIGFAIYRVDDEAVKSMDDDGGLMRDFYENNKSVDRTEFLVTRSVTKTCKLTPGDYVIIPSTFEPNHEGKFLLRIYSNAEQLTPTTFNKIAKEADLTLEAKLKALFDKIAGTDEKMDSFEVQKLLETVLKKDLGGAALNIEVARAVMTSVDENHDAEVNFNEFKNFLTKVKKWARLFSQYDKDGTGDLDLMELRGLLRKEGFALSNTSLDVVYKRYLNKKGKIMIADCFTILAKVYKTFALFEKYETTPGKAVINLDQFASAVLGT